MVQYNGWDLSRAQKMAIRNEAYRVGVLAAVRRGIGASEMALIVRETNAGAAAGTADAGLIDLTFLTASVAGQEFWGEDAADLTANTLSSIFTADLPIPDDKIVVIYGFWDRTAAPDLIMVRFKRGQEVLDVWNVEGSYVQPFEVNGFTNEPQIYEDDDVIDVQMAFKTAADKLVGLYAYTVERAGVNISQTRRKMRISKEDIQAARTEARTEG